MARELKFFKTGNRLHGQVIDWCKRLHDAEIRSLDLYRTRRPTRLGLSVVITLLDDSKYCLKRKIKPIGELEFIPGFVDTIEQIHTPLPAELDPHALINMQFRPGHRPSLIFILIACYGIQSHHGLFRASEIIADSDFFALALVLNVARKCIYHRDIVHAPASTRSPLNLLWQEVYHSIQNEEYTFWGDAVAEQTKNITRELVYKAARKRIITLLTCEESIAASAIARVEVLAKRKDLSHPTLWDEAWDKHWKEVWSNHRFPAHPGTNSVVGSTLLSDLNTLEIEVDGRAPGGKAGRTLSKIPVEKGNKILFDALLKDLRSHPRAEYSIGENGGKATMNESAATDASPLGKISELKIWPGYCIPVAQDQVDVIWASPREMAVEVAWEEAWNTAVIQGRRAAEGIQKNENPNSEPANTNPQSNSQNNRFVHILASGKRNLEATFQNSSSRSKKLASRFISHAKRRPNIDHSRNHPNIEPSRPAPNPAQATQVDPLPRQHPPTAEVSSSTEIAHTPGPFLGSPIGLDQEDKHAFQLSIQERRYLERKELARVKAKEAVQLIRSEGGKRPKLLNNGSEYAWKHTSPGIYTNPTLEELANQAVQKLLAQSGPVRLEDNPKLDTKSESTRKEFKETWERAWKESWDVAWEAVWEATWKAAVARGVEFGAESIFDKEPGLARGRYDGLQHTEPYKAVETSLEKDTALATLEQLRIMMKELYHLYELLHHSVSDCRDDHVDIIVTETNKSTHKNSPVNATKHMTCFELQIWVEEQFLNTKFHVGLQAHSRKVFKRGIAEVWKSVSLIEEK